MTSEGREKTAFQGLVSGARVLSDNDLSARSRAAASVLHAAGIWEGNTVAILMRNDFAWFEVTRGAALLGASTVPLNWHLSPEEIAFILDDCDARAIVAHSDLLTESVLAVCDGREVFSVATPDEVVAAYRLDRERCQPAGALPDWDSLIANAPQWERQAQSIAQPMFYTSGTTGRPKGVKRKAVGVDIAMTAMRRGAMAFGLDSDGVRAVMTGPLYHSAPNSYAMRAASMNGILVLQPRFDATELLQLIDEWKITHLHMVPTMFVRLLALPEDVKQRFDVSSLQFVCHGSAPCPPDIKRQMIDWWGTVIHEYYAMTETGIITVSDSHGWLAHPGSVGHAAPGVSIRIVDDEEQPCPPRQPGEIQIASETTPYFTYYHDDAKTQAVRNGNYVRTGDIGWLDDDGYLYISDRKTDMVISGGVNIYPAEIEQFLVNIAGVRDCAVFGIPDREFGERLVAVVDGDPDISAQHIQTELRQHLAGFKVPREIRLQDGLPREDTGKIKKRLLRDEWMAHPTTG